MDYKKKYEQAIENIKKIKNANKDNKALVDFIEYEYPELKESEDEKVRKHLLRHFRNKTKEKWNGIPVKNILAWLEKKKDHEDELERAYKCADEVQYRKGFEDGVASVKPAEWSEKDEKMRIKILEALSAYANHVQYTGFCVNAEFIRGELMGWLKSLKLQPKQEWSEEDEEMFDSIHYSDGEDYTLLESDILYGKSKDDCRRIVKDWYNENVPKALQMALDKLKQE